MGRHKLIETEDLIARAEAFIKEACSGDVRKFKVAKFSRYLKDNGLPINESVIRRNADLMVHFSEKKAEMNALVQQNVVYERMDVDGLFNSGRSISSIKIAINNREDYYKLVYDSFVEMRNKSNEINHRNSEIICENEVLKKEVLRLKNELSHVKADFRETKAQMIAYREQVTDYVYPSIAMEIIKQIEPTLIIETPELVDPEIVDEKIITTDSDLFKNPLINDLYRVCERE